MPAAVAWSGAKLPRIFPLDAGRGTILVRRNFAADKT